MIFDSFRSDIYLFILLCCGIGTLVVSYKYKLARHLTFFAYLSLLTFFSELTAFLVGHYTHNNWKILNCFVLVETLGHAYYFFLIIKLRLFKKLILYLAGIYSLFWCYSNIFIIDFFRKGDMIWNSYNIIFASILTLIFCVAYLYQLIEIENIYPLTKYTEFWIAFAMLIFYTCQIPYFGAYNYVIVNKINIRYTNFDVLRSLILYLNDLMYGTFIYAYLCKTNFKIRLMKFH